jgi:zinc D-Ala-D-Ala dipeptidase
MAKQTLRITMAAFAALLLVVQGQSQAQSMPTQARPKRSSDLVDILRVDARIHLDLRYASNRNFLGRQFYTSPRALLQRDAALALAKVNASVRRKGFGLLVTDAYRPWRVTVQFWQAATPAMRRGGYVAKPADGSRHNRGCAVDVTLFDLSTGREVTMPSQVDEMTLRADPGYQGSNGESLAARNLLIQEMAKAGFSVLYNEWWHFDFRDWRDYALLDVDFEDVP